MFQNYTDGNGKSGRTWFWKAHSINAETDAATIEKYIKKNQATLWSEDGTFEIDSEKVKSNMETMRKEFVGCNQEMLNGVVNAKSFNEATSNLTENAKKAASTFSGFKAKLSGVGSFLKNMAFSLAQTAINFAAMAAISAVASAIQGYINRYETYAEELEQKASEWQEASDNLDSHSKTISEISDEYEALSKGVNSYGENVSLTSDQYDRYITLSNQIAEIYPSLVESYDEQGNAILKCKDNVESLTQALEEEQDAYYSTILQDAGTQWEDFSASITGYNGSNWNNLGYAGTSISDQKKKAEEIISNLQNGAYDLDRFLAKGGVVSKLFEESGADAYLNTVYVNQGGQGDNYYAYSMSEDDVQNVVTQLQSYIDTIDSEIQDYIDDNAYPIVEAYVKKSTSYKELESDSQDIVDSIISQFDFDNFYSKFVGKYDNAGDAYNVMTDYVRDNIIGIFKVDDKDIQSEVISAWNSATQAVKDFDNGDSTEEDFQTAKSKFTDLLSSLGIDQEQQAFLCSITFDKVEVADGVSPEAAVENIVSRIKQLPADFETIPGILGDNESQELLGFLNSLSETDLSYLYNEADIAGMSIEELTAKLEAFHEEEKANATFSISSDDAISDMSNLSSALSTVKQAIQDYNESGYLSFSNLKSLLEIDDAYLLALTNEQGQLEINADSYKNLAEAQAVQMKAALLQESLDSIDEITTKTAAIEYLTSCQEDAAQSTLDYASAKWAEAMATAAAKDAEQGTGTLYQQVVQQKYKAWQTQSALIDTYTKTAGAEDDLVSVSGEYKDALEDEQKALEESKSALEDKKEALEDTKDGYEDALSALQDLIDWTEKYIKQTKEDEKEALQERKEYVDDLIESKKELLNAEKDEYEFNKEVRDKQNTVASNALSAAVASLDDSSAGKKAYKEANDDLIESRNDIQDYLYEHEIEVRQDALDKLKEDIDEYYDDQIDTITEYLSKEGQLYRDACAMIDNDTGELYGKLLNYCLTYTSTTETEFNYMWTSAQSAMEEYNTANLSTYGLLELLQGKIYEVDNAINAVADSISEYEDKIQAVEDKLNNLSEAAANAKSAATEAIDSTSDYKYKYKYDGLTYYSTKSQKEDAVIDILNQMTKRDTNAKALLKSKGWQGLSSMISSGISKYAKGTKSAKGGITNFDEEGLYSELIPYQVGEGRYTILPQGNPVFSKSMTNELFDFASDPTSYMKSIFDSGYQRDYKAVSNNTSMSSSVNINIAGDATQSTVNALKAQADNIIKRATQNVMNAALRNKNII